ncbi:MAG: hypothetical protein U5K27_19140 [Desulfotignum sp.]|nr:hypothetical protein [Desulfotignum sp.]
MVDVATMADHQNDTSPSVLLKRLCRVPGIRQNAPQSTTSYTLVDTSPATTCGEDSDWAKAKYRTIFKGDPMCQDKADKGPPASTAISRKTSALWQ